ncbi:hypothetical protein GQ53DRAFT_880169 [Thozetella sp. PMI_491]|nr:hypothetical protein GQ53DRAFT_880169 [Thozetella sp. PMI_491]
MALIVPDPNVGLQAAPNSATPFHLRGCRLQMQREARPRRGWHDLLEPKEGSMRNTKVRRHVSASAPSVEGAASLRSRSSIRIEMELTPSWREAWGPGPWGWASTSLLWPPPVHADQTTAAGDDADITRGKHPGASRMPRPVNCGRSAGERTRRRPAGHL